MTGETLKALLDKLSDILNEFEDNNNAVIRVDIDISTRASTSCYTFDGAHFTEIDPEYCF